MNYTFLLDLALILLCTKLFGLFSRKIKLPQVAGALLVGVILGPAMLNLVCPTEFLQCLSQAGVIVLMFLAGMEADIGQLKATGKASFVIALCGVLFPLLLGTVVALSFGIGAGEAHGMLKTIFIGIILTATSVSITVETLREMGRLSS